MKDILNVAVIGCGYWGPNIIRNLEKLAESRVVVCCDIDKEKLGKVKRSYPHIKTTKTASTIFQDPDIDAVAIVTPPSTHYDLAQEALRQGKHVLVEKPLATSSEKARELIQLAKEENKVLMVDHTFIFSSPVEEIKKLIQSGVLGDIFAIDFSWLNFGLFQEDNVLWDILPHLVSILLFILIEEPSRVQVSGKASIKSGLVDTVQLIWHFKSGLTVTAQISWLWPEKVRKAIFVGSEKMLIYDDLKTFDKLTLFDKGVTFDPEKRAYQYREGLVTNLKLEIKEPLGKVCAHFIGSVKKNKIEKSDGEFGLKVVRLIEEAQEALKIL